MNNTKLILISFSFLFFIISGCASHSEALLLYSGKLELILDDNAIIIGRAFDKNTNEVLGGVNIIFKSTTIGTVTDSYGNYNLLKIPPGTYNIRASYVGYEPIDLINFKIEKGHQYIIDFKFQQKPLEGPLVI